MSDPNGVDYVYRDERVSLYREPVFTFNRAKNVWNKSYWVLCGRKMLEFIRHMGLVYRPPTVYGFWDHRAGMDPFASTRRCCWIKPVEAGEIPADIENSYSNPSLEIPQHMTMEQEAKYILGRTWALVFFKWDTMGIKPYEFNTLLKKILLVADNQKIGLVLVDTKDLYVNVNPSEFTKMYEKPYPVADLKGQEEAYDQWLCYSGFNRRYILNSQGNLIETPWYYRIPKSDEDNESIKFYEQPEYKLHPIQVTGGTFYPVGYKED